MLMSELHDGCMLFRSIVMQNGTSRLTDAPLEMSVTGTIELKRRLVL